MRFIPRFKYSYSLTDLFNGLFRRNSNYLAIEQYFDNDSIFFTNHGRVALRLILSAIKEKYGFKRVAVQAFTCETVFQAIEKAGCEIVFIDINKNFNLSSHNVREKLNDFDILILTHTFGIVADTNDIIEICKSKYIIEDCAHALFSYYDKQACGTFGDASIFSIGYGKYPSIGPGGWLLVNNKKLLTEIGVQYAKLPENKLIDEFFNCIKNYFYAKAFSPFIYKYFTKPLFKGVDRKLDFLGKKSFIEKRIYKSNLSVLIKNFKKYKRRAGRQRDNGNIIINLISEKYTLSKENNDKENNHFTIPLLSSDRDSIIKILLRKGIESGAHFSKSIDQAMLYGYEKGCCPVAESISDQIFTIPCHHDLKENSLHYITNILFKKKND